MTAGSPSRWPRAWRTTPTRPRPRPSTCGGWSTGRTSTSRSRRRRPACPAITDTDRQGHQCQRHPDLQPRALPGGHGRLPLRPGEAGGRRRLARGHRVGRVVLRLPRGHRDRQAPRQGRRRPRAQGQGRASPTPSWPTRPTRRSSPPTAGRRSRRRAPCRSGRCGRRPASRTPSTRDTHVHQRADRARHGQHHAREDDDGLRRPRQPRHAGAEVLRRRDRGHAVRRRRRRRPRRRLPRARGRGRAEVRRLLGRADRVGAHASWRTRASDLLPVSASATGWTSPTPLRAQLAEDDVAARLVRKDATLWGPDAESEAAVRLGWLDLPASSRRAGRAGWPSCGPSWPPRASTGSSSAAWAGRRWRRRSSAATAGVPAGRARHHRPRPGARPR